MKLGGKYQVQGTIGQGGMGTVVRALDPKGKAVAVKMLLNPKADRVRRFTRERRLLKKLGESQGFVPILDWGESELGPFFVMPLLEGGSLGERLEKGALGVTESVELVATLAKAMGKAHDKGIVHRDLKPDNVLFKSDGSPLITDLGLAKFFREDQRHERSQTTGRLSTSGEARGTWGYMAPEQIRDAKNVTPRADVFALGALLHECVTGVPAFPGLHPLQVVAQVTAGKLEDLDARADVPGWLKELIHHALAFDQKERPADGAALAHALRKSLGKARKRTRWRNRRIAVYVGVALGVVIGLRYSAELSPYVQRLPDLPAIAPTDGGAAAIGSTTPIRKSIRKPVGEGR